MTYLPSGGAVGVAFIFEVGNVLDHPVVNLRQGEALIGAALNGLRYEIGVRHVAPGVASARILLGGGGDAGAAQRRLATITVDG